MKKKKGSVNEGIRRQRKSGNGEEEEKIREIVSQYGMRIGKEERKSRGNGLTKGKIGSYNLLKKI